MEDSFFSTKFSSVNDEINTIKEQNDEINYNGNIAKVKVKVKKEILNSEFTVDDACDFVKKVFTAAGEREISVGDGVDIWIVKKDDNTDDNDSNNNSNSNSKNNNDNNRHSTDSNNNNYYGNSDIVNNLMNEDADSLNISMESEALPIQDKEYENSSLKESIEKNINLKSSAEKKVYRKKGAFHVEKRFFSLTKS